MNKIAKIIIYTLVTIVIVLGVVSYLETGGFNGVSKSLSGHCKEFRTKVDKKSEANITEIISTMADTSTLGLAFKSNHLKELGKQVDESVPSPLVFLYVIFSDQKLANDMKIIKKSSFKYNNFCEGLYKNMMTSYHNKECFKKNMYSFAKTLKLDKEKTYIVAKTCGRHGENKNKDAFRPFVDYLIQHLSK